MAKPTILLVSGSFCSSSLVFDQVITKLRAEGYEAIPIELLSATAPSTAKAATMEDDAARIHGVTEYVLDSGKDVVIAMNSYGGVPATQACQRLSRKEREAAGKTNGVVGLVYLTALLVQENESLAESLNTGAGLPDYLKVQGDYMTLEPAAHAAVTFNDLPRDVGEAWAARMPGHSAPSFMGKLTSTSHHHIPITYLLCTNDQVIPPAHQRKMVDDVKKVTQSTVDVIELDSGHCPHISHPEESARAIQKAAGEA